MQALRAVQLSIYLTIRYNDIEVFKLLLPSVPLKEPLPNGMTLMQEVILHKRTEMLYLLLEIVSLNDDGWDVINHVMSYAKRYYSDEKYRTAVDTVITDMATNF